MDYWTTLLVAALVGAFAALLVQNIAYPFALQRWAEWQERKRILRVNRAWESSRRLVPNLQLLQAGWLSDGTFAPEHIKLRLVGTYQMPGDIRTRIRARHEATWTAEGLTDSEQVGINALRIYRTSDDPVAERCGLSHVIEIDAHVYRYFDFLATHRLLGSGSLDEKQLLHTYVSEPNAEEAICGFPNPLSAGLSLFCESGNVLVLLIRSKTTAAGGGWHGGKLFNSVGENATPSDFRPTFAGHFESSPLEIARRGLFQEMGFSEGESNRCAVSIHSLAWATDILDYKFFGYALTPLSEREVKHRWEHARDRFENRDIRFVDVSTRRACVQLWTEMRTQLQTCSPEALFCTMRSLMLLRKLNSNDVLG